MIMHHFPLLYVLAITTVLCSCIQYSPYEITVSKEEGNLTRKNLDKLNRLNQESDTITFAFIGDTQRFYDESLDFVKAVNKQKDIEFVVISGDLTDFGLDDEFTGIATIFNKLNVPFLTVIGNHDLIYNGQQVYEKMFGPMDYTFYFKGMKFIMLNTNSREFRFNGHVPDVAWLNRQLSDTGSYRNAVVIGHVPPDHSDFDPELELPYAYALSKWGKTLLSMNGHTHHFRVGKLYGDGITYLNAFTIGKKQYTVVQLWTNGFAYKNVSL